MARRAYELGRARHAAWAALPTLAVVAVAALMSHGRATVSVAGTALYCTAALFHWRGRHLARGVARGVAAGLVPFALAHAARTYGHLCAPGGCASLCVPACVFGGIIAGAAVALAARRSPRRWASWAATGTIAALTGALGCACVGMSGLVGLGAGLLLGTSPIVLRPAPAR
jgi:hypothetical protein